MAQKKSKKITPVKKVVAARPANRRSHLLAVIRALNGSRLFALSSLLILGLSSILWSILGASLQQNNADQLASPYLFESASTFHNADFPGTHTFLIKWPLFWLVKLFGYSNSAFTSLTVLSVLATVAILVWILYRIERRPLFFGTLCLALASVLLLVPAQPYAGGLLPVNLAMLATRNLEYVAYIATVAFFVRAKGWRDWRFWIAVSILGLLSASDKLFLTISIISALLALAVYSIKRAWEYVNLSSSWLIAALAASALGILVISIINVSGITNISSGASPFTLAASAKDLALGILYSIMGLATNFGANPAYDATIVRHIPHQFFSRLFSLDGPAYFINFLILCFGLFSAHRLLKSSLGSRRKRLVLDRYSGIGLLMLWSAIAAVGLFIISSHYYAVDARYLTITLFSLFISGALFIRNRNWAARNIMKVAAVLILGILLGVFSNIRDNRHQAKALADMKQRNLLVAQALKGHPVDTLVGDYWRVMPARQASGNKLRVMPLTSCTVPRETLSSKNWRPGLKHRRFGYLLSLDQGLSDFPRCKFSQILTTYGRPNSTILIAGSFNSPKELLLIYDHGTSGSKSSEINAPANILPLNLSDLTSTSCSVPTVMNIVAHQDDDLLFMNPDLAHDIKAGHCIRSIYLTAGDSGLDKFYWLAREQGSETAYSRMLGKPQTWIERLVKINDKEFITIANPKGNNSISLIFVHLPDGGLRGDGFNATNFESLEKLDADKIHSIQSVDNQSLYTAPQLVSLLSTLMHAYQPTEIRTQANYGGNQFPDHSDHMAVGRFVKKAYSLYETQQFEGEVNIPIKFYIGYPVHELPENVADGELQEKEAVFLEYARFDGSVCQSQEQCGETPTYGAYLSRQYQNAY